MRFLIIIAAASVAFAQSTQVFRLTQHESRQELEEIARLLQATAEVQHVSSDEVVSSVAIEGTMTQIATAAWLLHQLDLPANAPLSGVHEYRPASGDDDVVRVLYATHAATMDQLQGICNAVQVMLHFEKWFGVYNKLNALVVRGTGQQVSLVAWLVEELDNPANVADPSVHEYQVAGDDVARVFYLANGQTLGQLNEMVTIILAVADVSRVSRCKERHAIVMRNTPERVALTAWLVCKLDKPLRGSTTRCGPTQREFQLADDPENLVRVYFVQGAQSEEQYQKLAMLIRRKAGTARLFVYTALGALVVRGSAGQLAVAENVIEEMHPR